MKLITVHVTRCPQCPYHRAPATETGIIHVCLQLHRTVVPENDIHVACPYDDA